MCLNFFINLFCYLKRNRDISFSKSHRQLRIRSICSPTLWFMIYYYSSWSLDKQGKLTTYVEKLWVPSKKKTNEYWIWWYIVIFKERSTNNIWSVIVFWLSKSHMVSFVGLLRGPSQLNTMNEMRASTQATRPRSHPRVSLYII
jgi:hypothetical protein